MPGLPPPVPPPTPLPLVNPNGHARVLATYEGDIGEDALARLRYLDQQEKAARAEKDVFCDGFRSGKGIPRGVPIRFDLDSGKYTAPDPSLTEQQGNG